MEGRRLAGFMLMELWMEEEENKRKAEEFKIRRWVDWFLDGGWEVRQACVEVEDWT